MQRIDCLKALVPYIKDQLVVITLGRTALEWAEVCPREGNLFNSGMGQSHSGCFGSGQGAAASPNYSPRQRWQRSYAAACTHDVGIVSGTKFENFRLRQ